MSGEHYESEIRNYIELLIETEGITSPRELAEEAAAWFFGYDLETGEIEDVIVEIAFTVAQETAQ